VAKLPTAIMRTWFSASRFDVAVPVGAPPAVFIPLYTEELRKKLVSLLGTGGYQISIERTTADKYRILVLRGALSGMEVVVEMKVSLGAPSSHATVSVDPSSKTERVLVKIFRVLLLLAAIPVFFILFFVLRLLIFAAIATLIAVIPLAVCMGLANAAVMLVLYKIYDNEFDSARRTAIAGALQQVVVPDPLAALRQSAGAPIAPKGA
jgi:hypothetical protein